MGIYVCWWCWSRSLKLISLAPDGLSLQRPVNSLHSDLEAAVTLVNVTV